MQNIELNGLINKEGKRKELSKIEYPFKCICGCKLFIEVSQLQKIKLEGEEHFRPKSSKYICFNCQNDVQINV